MYGPGVPSPRPPSGLFGNNSGSPGADVCGGGKGQLMFPPPPPPYPASWDTTGRPPMGPGVPFQGGPNLNYMGNDLKGSPQSDGGGNFHSPYPSRPGAWGKKGNQSQGKGQQGQQGHWGQEDPRTRKQRNRTTKSQRKAAQREENGGGTASGMGKKEVNAATQRAANATQGTMLLIFPGKVTGPYVRREGGGFIIMHEYDGLRVDEFASSDTSLRLSREADEHGLVYLFVPAAWVADARAARH